MFGDLSSVIAGIAVLAAEANLCGVHEEKGEARMDGHRTSPRFRAQGGTCDGREPITPLT